MARNRILLYNSIIVLSCGSLSGSGSQYKISVSLQILFANRFVMIPDVHCLLRLYCWCIIKKIREIIRLEMFHVYPHLLQDKEIKDNNFLNVIKLCARLQTSVRMTTTKQSRTTWFMSTLRRRLLAGCSQAATVILRKLYYCYIHELYVVK